MYIFIILWGVGFMLASLMELYSSDLLNTIIFIVGLCMVIFSGMKLFKNEEMIFDDNKEDSDKNIEDDFWYKDNPRMTKSWNKRAKTIEALNRAEQRKSGRFEGYNKPIHVDALPDPDQDDLIYERGLEKFNGRTGVFLHIKNSKGEEATGIERQHLLSHDSNLNTRIKEIPRGSCHYDSQLGEWVED